MINDCTACGHDSRSHNTGTCNVVGWGTKDGYTEYPGGCGCQAMALDSICTTCGKPFVCGIPGHEPHQCYACWQKDKDSEDERSFRPLIDALQARNIPVSEKDIWNTGGNVMCLGLPVTETKDGPYVMWSDAAEYIGYGLYPDSDHVGFFLSPADETDVLGDERPEEAYDWHYRDNAERAAVFAARTLPEVVRWLDAQTFDVGTAKDGFTGKDYTTRTIIYDTPPVIEGAVVEDFNR